MSSTRDFKSPGIFAENATTVIPPTPIAGVAYRDQVNGTDDTPNGWRYGTKVESQDWNQIMFLLTSMLDSIDRQGLLGWSSEVDYATPAIVFGSNGVPYLALQASGPSTSPQDPVSSPNFWEQLLAHGRVVITTLGASNWAVPMAMQLGLVKPVVTVIGGGGGGSYSTTAGANQPNGGSGGGIASRVVDLTGVSTVAVTVGAGGTAAVANPGPGGAGGSTNFGAYCSATGGGGGSIGGVLNMPGIGSGGTINQSIGYGGFAVRDAAGTGFLGGQGGGGSSPAALGVGPPTQFGHGAGGRNSGVGVSAALPGFQGAIIIEW